MELSAQSGFLCRVSPAHEIPANPVPRTFTERRELWDPPEPQKFISLSKCPVFPTRRNFVQFLHVVQSDDTR